MRLLAITTSITHCGKITGTDHKIKTGLAYILKLSLTRSNDITGISSVFTTGSVSTMNSKSVFFEPKSSSNSSPLFLISVIRSSSQGCVKKSATQSLDF